jgi:hydroxymethylpyrimidine/phosphomethylpyrimidine kinase
MLASAPVIETVADAVELHGLDRLVVDPVFVSKHGDALLAEDAVDALTKRLFPLAAVVTPNLHEAGAILGDEITTADGMRAAARALHSLGPRAVLVKGGHLGDERAVDVFFDGTETVEIAGPRYETDDTHGTGCALAAAIAARLAHGDDLATAVRFAKDFVAGAIDRSLRLGKGFGPVNPAWRLNV